MAPNSLLCNNDDVHCRALSCSFHNYNYDYVQGMRASYFFSPVKREGATYAAAFHNVAGMKLLEDG